MIVKYLLLICVSNNFAQQRCPWKGRVQSKMAKVIRRGRARRVAVTAFVLMTMIYRIKKYLFKSVVRLEKQKTLALLLMAGRSTSGQSSLSMARISSYSFFFVLRFL